MNESIEDFVWRLLCKIDYDIAKDFKESGDIEMIQEEIEHFIKVNSEDE